MFVPLLIAAGMLGNLFGHGNSQSAAPAPAPRPDQMQDTFTIEAIQTAAHTLGLESQIANDGDQRFVVIMLKRGSVLAIPTRCQKADPARCNTFEMLAVYSQKNVPLAAINNFNDEQNFAQAFEHNGTVELARSDFQAYGFPRGNLTESMRSFINLASQFTDYLKSVRPASAVGTTGATEALSDAALAESNSFTFPGLSHLRTGVADPRYMDPKLAQ